MEWAEDGLCRRRPDLDFFPDARPDAPVSHAIKRLCTECPVRTVCETHALHHERFGIWAGKNASQLGKERRRRDIPLVTLSYESMFPPVINNPNQVRGDDGRFIPNNNHEVHNKEQVTV